MDREQHLKLNSGLFHILLIVIMFFLVVFSFFVVKKVGEQKELEIVELTCDLYSTCNKIEFEPLTKIYTFCGVKVSEQDLKDKCLS